MFKSATLKADNAIDIIDLLSNNLDTEVHKDNNEYCFDMPDDVGSGYIKAINFDSGISIIETDLLLKSTFRLNFKKEKFNPLVILFNSQSPIKHTSSSSDSRKNIQRFESLMFSNDMMDHNSISIIKNQPTSFIQLFINRKAFEPKLEAFIDEMDPEIETLFRDVNGVNLFDYKGHYSIDISEIIDEIKNCDKEGLVKSIFIEGKIYELLTLHLQQYKDDLKGPEKQQILRRSTIDKIEEAAELVKNDLATSLSVNQLAKKVGLNQNTLQTGFQHLFKSSVNDYIRSKRIEKSKELIETSDLNITEITYAVGINSRSYFSKLFKEKYKLTPKQYLNQKRKGKTA